MEAAAAGRAAPSETDPVQMDSWVARVFEMGGEQWSAEEVKHALTTARGAARAASAHAPDSLSYDSTSADSEVVNKALSLLMDPGPGAAAPGWALDMDTLGSDSGATGVTTDSGRATRQPARYAPPLQQPPAAKRRRNGGGGGGGGRSGGGGRKEGGLGRGGGGGGGAGGAAGAAGAGAGAAGAGAGAAGAGAGAGGAGGATGAAGGSSSSVAAAAAAAATCRPADRPAAAAASAAASAQHRPEWPPPRAKSSSRSGGGGGGGNGSAIASSDPSDLAGTTIFYYFCEADVRASALQIASGWHKGSLGARIQNTRPGKYGQPSCWHKMRGLWQGTVDVDASEFLYKHAAWYKESDILSGAAAVTAGLRVLAIWPGNGQLYAGKVQRVHSSADSRSEFTDLITSFEGLEIIEFTVKFDDDGEECVTDLILKHRPLCRQTRDCLCTGRGAQRVQLHQSHLGLVLGKFCTNLCTAYGMAMGDQFGMENLTVTAELDEVGLAMEPIKTVLERLHLLHAELGPWGDIPLKYFQSGVTLSVAATEQLIARVAEAANKKVRAAHEFAPAEFTQDGLQFNAVVGHQRWDLDVSSWISLMKQSFVEEVSLSPGHATMREACAICCTAASSSVVLVEHPIFQNALICCGDLQVYTEKFRAPQLEAEGSRQYHLICLFCAHAGATVMLCEGDDCPHVICAPCLVHLGAKASEDDFKKLEGSSTEQHRFLCWTCDDRSQLLGVGLASADPVPCTGPVPWPDWRARQQGLMDSPRMDSSTAASAAALAAAPGAAAAATVQRSAAFNGTFDDDGDETDDSLSDSDSEYGGDAFDHFYDDEDETTETPMRPAAVRAPVAASPRTRRGKGPSNTRGLGNSNNQVSTHNRFAADGETRLREYVQFQKPNAVRQGANPLSWTLSHLPVFLAVLISWPNEYTHNPCATCRLQLFELSVQNKDWIPLLTKTVKLPVHMVDARVVSAAPRRRYFWSQTLPSAQDQIDGSNPNVRDFIQERDPNGERFLPLDKWAVGDARARPGPKQEKFATITTKRGQDHQQNLNYFLIDDLVGKAEQMCRKLSEKIDSPQTAGSKRADFVQRRREIRDYIQRRREISRSSNSGFTFADFDQRCPHAHGTTKRKCSLPSCPWCTQTKKMRQHNLIWLNNGLLSPLPFHWIEELMGLPKDYTAPIASAHQRMKALGNAVNTDVICHELGPEMEKLRLRAADANGVVTQLVVLSLFNGIDGFLIGLEKAAKKARLVLKQLIFIAVEKDPNCWPCTRHNFRSHAGRADWLLIDEVHDVSDLRTHCASRTLAKILSDLIAKRCAQRGWGRHHSAHDGLQPR